MNDISAARSQALKEMAFLKPMLECRTFKITSGERSRMISLALSHASVNLF